MCRTYAQHLGVGMRFVVAAAVMEHDEARRLDSSHVSDFRLESSGLGFRVWGARYACAGCECQ